VRPCGKIERTKHPRLHCFNEKLWHDVRKAMSQAGAGEVKMVEYIFATSTVDNRYISHNNIMSEGCHDEQNPYMSRKVSGYDVRIWK
jgi:hypothetical protein